MMTHDDGAGIALVELFEQASHRHLLFSRASVIGLTSGVQTALVTYSDGVLIVVHAVGPYLPFRASWLNLSVTTDYVMVTNAEFIMSVSAVPCVDLSGGTELIGFHCRTVNDNQSNGSHDSTTMVPKTVVTTVAIYLMTLITFFQFIFFFIN